jgi:hypothetical protein
MFRFARRLKTSSSARRSPSRRSRLGASPHLGVEALEDRSVPSSLVTPQLGSLAVADGGSKLAQIAVPSSAGASDPIQAKWLSLGGAQGFLGKAVTAELTAPDGFGRFEYFQGGSIYWTASTGADVVKGAILGKWGSLGWEKSLLGYPLTDELPMPNGIGRYNHFQNGTILWYPGLGTFLSFDRNEMLKVFARLGASGIVMSNDISTLQGWLADRVGVWMTEDVRNLASKVVNGDHANATYQFLDSLGNVKTIGLGNLHAGSSRTQLTELVNKWFLGIDEPMADVRYQAVTNIPLSSNGFNYYDVNQGALGDCWLLASLAATAARAPSALQTMFIYNGTNIVNGATVDVWTVRFFRSGVPEYITVDTELPAGGHYYDNITHANLNGTVSTELWVALAEKAYAQTNHSGWIGSDNKGVNSYAALMGGWPSFALSAITGLPSNPNAPFGHSVPINGSDLVSAWNNGQLIVLDSAPAYLLVSARIVPAHAYAVVGYDASTKLFKVFNPWGIKLTIPGFSNNYSCYDLFTANAAFLVQNFSGETFAGAVLRTTGGVQVAGSAGRLLGMLPVPSNASPGQPQTTTEQTPLALARETSTGHLDAVFSSLCCPLQGHVKMAAQRVAGEGQSDWEASDLLFAHDPVLLGSLDGEVAQSA